MKALGTTRVQILGVVCAIACAIGLGCAGDDDGDADDWSLVFENLDGALISVDGTSSKDVWAVGADTRDGEGALVLHYDGTHWQRYNVEVEADLWWVHVFDKRSVYFGGAKGTIVHYDGKTFKRMDTPREDTVYGIWGASQDDVWAVGGQPEVTPGFVWHLEDGEWIDKSEMLPTGTDGPGLFKLWGQAADDAWIVGSEGTVMHWNGSEFEMADSDTEQPLYTVHGVKGGKPAFVAVGGDSSAVILERSGSGSKWHNVAPDGVPPLVGVFMQSATHGYAVGFLGAIAERTDTAWKLLDTGHELSGSFHTVWVDPDGGVWAVGGMLDSETPSEGMLLHRGETIAHDIVELDP